MCLTSWSVVLLVNLNKCFVAPYMERVSYCKQCWNVTSKICSMVYYEPSNWQLTPYMEGFRIAKVITGKVYST